MTEEWTKERVCRVVFLGYHGVGKTSVVARLTGNKGMYGQAGSVVAIPWKATYKADKATDYPLRLECVDFGATVDDKLFRCFYTSGVLYVVVCRASQNYQRQAKRWLSELEQFAPGCPVIVLLNLTAENPECEDFEIKGLQDCNHMFKAQYHRFRIAAEMLAQLEDQSEFAQYATNRLNDNWETMRKEILYQAYLLCKDGGDRRPELPFKDLRRMALGLGQLMNGWKAASRAARVAAFPAIANRRDAEAILNADPEQRGYPRFTEQETNDLLKLLTEREVFFRILPAQRGREEEEERLLIPANVPDTFAELSDEAKNKINRNFYANQDTLHYQCEVNPYIPRYIFPLMLNKDIGSLEVDCIWKYGAVFRSTSGACQALAQVHHERMDIWIYSQDDRKERHKYLVKLKKALTDCLYEKLKGHLWDIQEEFLLFVAETVRDDGTSAKVDCKVSYAEALENFQAEKDTEKAKPIYVEELRKDMDPGVILHQKRQDESRIAKSLNAAHNWLEPFRKLAENMEAAETTVSGAKGVFSFLKAALLWLLKRFLV